MRKENPLKLSRGDAGRSGRRKICIVDWDGDGRRDILINSQNADWFCATYQPTAESHASRIEGWSTHEFLPAIRRVPPRSTWDGNGVPDLLLGAEDGFFYYKRRQKIADR